MITKERLEELIKQGATVWEAKYGKVKEFNLSTIGDCFMSKEYINVHFYQPHNFITRKRYDKLFEDKEEAEWFSKFGNISRIETLNLPTWEEFVKIEESSDYGFTDIKRFDNVRFGYKYCPEKQTSALFVDKNGETLFYTLMVTKENYLEACKLARDLFL